MKRVFSVSGLPHSAAGRDPSEQHQPRGVCVRSAFSLCWYRPDLYLPPGHHWKLFWVNTSMCLISQSLISNIPFSTNDVINMMLCCFICSTFTKLSLIYSKHFISVTVHLHFEESTVKVWFDICIIMFSLQPEEKLNEDKLLINVWWWLLAINQETLVLHNRKRCNMRPWSTSWGSIIQNWDLYIIWKLNKSYFHWCMVCYDRTIFVNLESEGAKKSKFWENHL